MRKYTKEHIDYVKSIAKGRYNDEITKLFNEKFNVNKTVSAINSMKVNHGIKSGKLPGRRRQYARLFTVEQEEFIKDNAKGLYNDELAKLVNDKFNLNITRKQIATWKKNHNVTSGLNGRFEKGHETWNKGMKGLNTGGEKGWFKKGQPAINYRPVGSERVCSKDEYIIVKVQDEGGYQDRWRHKHVVVWEEAYGEVPEDSVVCFLDGNKENIALDNLALITRSELARMNQNGYFSSDPEITLAGIALARLNGRLSEIEFMGNNKEEFDKYVKQAAKNRINYQAFRMRLARGWSMNDAVNQPLHTRIIKRGEGA